MARDENLALEVNLKLIYSHKKWRFITFNQLKIICFQVQRSKLYKTKELNILKTQQLLGLMTY